MPTKQNRTFLLKRERFWKKVYLWWKKIMPITQKMCLRHRWWPQWCKQGRLWLKEGRLWQMARQMKQKKALVLQVMLWRRGRLAQRASSTQMVVHDHMILRGTVESWRVGHPTTVVSVFTVFTPDSGFHYPAGCRISRIVKNYPAGLFGRIVVMQNVACLVSTYL